MIFDIIIALLCGILGAVVTRLVLNKKLITTEKYNSHVKYENERLITENTNLMHQNKDLRSECLILNTQKDNMV
jgi:hypothetical protein